jgi:hypothetical protein
MLSSRLLLSIGVNCLLLSLDRFFPHFFFVYTFLGVPLVLKVTPAPPNITLLTTGGSYVRGLLVYQC